MNTYLNTGLQALGDPTRLAILRNLSARPLAVVELARGFSVSRPAISQHLRVLKDAGLVSDRHAGTQRIYQIDPAGVAALKAHFDALWSSVLDSFQALAEDAEQSAKSNPKSNPKLKSEKSNASRKRRLGRPRRRS